MHAFQGRTVDNVIAAMEANHPHLTTLKSFYVEISRARDRAELVTDDRAALREQLEAVTGERIAALEVIEPERAKDGDMREQAAKNAGRERASEPERSSGMERSQVPAVERVRTPMSIDRELGL